MTYDKPFKIGHREVDVWQIPVNDMSTGTKVIEVTLPHWACGKVDCDCDEQYEQLRDDIMQDEARDVAQEMPDAF